MPSQDPMNPAVIQASAALAGGHQRTDDVFPRLPEESDYYATLIDWNDPHDPLRQLHEPLNRLNGRTGAIPPHDGLQDTVPGCQHAFGSSALLNIAPEWLADTANLEPGLAYIASHPEINHVLLNGFDGFGLSMQQLSILLGRLRAISHVQIIRLATELPVRQPRRIYENEALLELLRTHSTPERRIYVMAHITHPRELTAEAKLSLEALQQAGAIVVNRTLLLRGINDDAAVLSELLDKLVWAGIAPYYLAMANPNGAHEAHALPLVRAYELVEEAKVLTTGLGKRVRLSMNHASGVVEVLAVEDGRAYLKLYRSGDARQGRFLMRDCGPELTWFDELHGTESEASAAAESEASAALETGGDLWLEPAPDVRIDWKQGERSEEIVSINMMPIGD
ncbi:KamA family radical SAM protein [Paenibacillus xanthanilyticus]|uniref:KamA family radical SAM protein n=1 Tax=Paenibacillus xanthanilyticus TaxID=1783531 RepID=A0ABV8K1C1_9BACL